MKLQPRRSVKSVKKVRVRGEQSAPPVNGDRTETDSTMSHHARIAAHAYAIYEQRGRQDGHDVEDWLAAEHLVSHDQNP
ncbi:MAG: DUF2934 domain-containing protein [Nitrospira sp.]|nr:DUF2934 domain-containing protein [Nitrospira sp.]